jgi:hypothetical protein
MMSAPRLVATSGVGRVRAAAAVLCAGTNFVIRQSVIAAVSGRVSSGASHLSTHTSPKTDDAGYFLGIKGCRLGVPHRGQLR